MTSRDVGAGDGQRHSEYENRYDIEAGIWVQEKRHGWWVHQHMRMIEETCDCDFGVSSDAGVQEQEY